MTEGFVMEIPNGRIAVNSWVEGAPEKSFWTGIKFRNKRRHPFKTYCCDQCGYMESYANLSLHGWKW